MGTRTPPSSKATINLQNTSVQSTRIKIKTAEEEIQFFLQKCSMPKILSRLQGSRYYDELFASPRLLSFQRSPVHFNKFILNNVLDYIFCNLKYGIEFIQYIL